MYIKTSMHNVYKLHEPKIVCVPITSSNIFLHRIRIKNPNSIFLYTCNDYDYKFYAFFHDFNVRLSFEEFLFRNKFVKTSEFVQYKI